MFRLSIETRTGFVLADSYLTARGALQRWAQEEAKGHKVMCRDERRELVTKSHLKDEMANG